MKTAGVFIFFVCQRSLKFRSKSNERSISVSYDRNFWDYLRSNYRNLPFRFWQTSSLPCFSYVRKSEKELKLLESDSLWLARFDRKFLGYSHTWSTPHVINAIVGALCPFLIFWREFFEARIQRLAAHGSRLGLAGSQNSLPSFQWTIVTWINPLTSNFEPIFEILTLVLVPNFNIKKEVDLHENEVKGNKYG